MLTTPLTVINFASRRPLALYPTTTLTYNVALNKKQHWCGGTVPLNVAKTDYAINGGDYYTSVGTVFRGDQGPQTVALATSPAG